MTLTVPRYILAANIQDTTIRYKWDDWDLEVAEGPFDQALHTRLSTVSQRANVAFTIACAEWIVNRFVLLMDDLTPLQYLEAAWAQTVDVLYSFPWELTDEEDWVGPVKRPVRRAMQLVTDGIGEMVSDADPALCSAVIAKLAEHVMSDPKPFQAWRDHILRRLEAAYPLDPDEAMGEVVPREALDPEFAFDPEETESLVNSFLARSNYRDNPFLHSPKEMRDEGFKGIPYTFSIESDRRNRFEW